MFAYIKVAREIEARWAAQPDPLNANRHEYMQMVARLTDQHCDKPSTSGLTYWDVDDQAGDIVDSVLDSIAIISDEGYTAELDDCATTWNKVG